MGKLYLTSSSLLDNLKNDYDVIVIGGGHAGIEAALSCARNHFNTLMICGNFKRVGNMPCNPSIGGPAKGIIVREIDALGRIVLPISIRKVYNLKERDGVEIFTDGDMIILKKYAPFCLFCGEQENLIKYKLKLPSKQKMGK